MTLKEKMYFDCTLNTDEQAEKNEKIAEDFAIEFAEWLNINYFQIIGTKTWCKTLSMKYKYTSKELLEIFKKEKGL